MRSNAGMANRQGDASSLREHFGLVWLGLVFEGRSSLRMKITVFWDATCYCPKLGIALSRIMWSSFLLEDGDFTAKIVVVDTTPSLLSRLVGRRSVIIPVDNNPHASIRPTHTERGPAQYLRDVSKQTLYWFPFLSECRMTGTVHVDTLKVLLILILFRIS